MWPMVLLLLFTLWLYTNNWVITECKFMTKNSTISFPVTHINVIILGASDMCEHA